MGMIGRVADQQGGRAEEGEVGERLAPGEVKSGGQRGGDGRQREQGCGRGHLG